MAQQSHVLQILLDLGIVSETIAQLLWQGKLQGSEWAKVLETENSITKEKQKKQVEMEGAGTQTIYGSVLCTALLCGEKED